MTYGMPRLRRRACACNASFERDAARTKGSAAQYLRRADVFPRPLDTTCLDSTHAVEPPIPRPLYQILQPQDPRGAVLKGFVARTVGPADVRYDHLNVPVAAETTFTIELDHVTNGGVAEPCRRDGRVLLAEIRQDGYSASDLVYDRLDLLERAVAPDPVLHRHRAARLEQTLEPARHLRLVGVRPQLGFLHTLAWIDQEFPNVWSSYPQTPRMTGMWA